jgi:hypothetical protein
MLTDKLYILRYVHGASHIYSNTVEPIEKRWLTTGKIATHRFALC